MENLKSLETLQLRVLACVLLDSFSLRKSHETRRAGHVIEDVYRRPWEERLYSEVGSVGGTFS